MSSPASTLSIMRGRQAVHTHGDRIDDLIDGVARRQPDATAVRHGVDRLTYVELVDRADRVAAELIRRGVTAGDVVAIRASRSLDTLTVLLAVLKAGGIYACAPVEWPLTRFRALVDQTSSRFCLTSADRSGTDAVTFAELISAGLRHNRPVDLAARQRSEAFCVFFTSGSSGKPKAALAPHRGVARTALDLAQRDDEPMVALQMASMAWDVFALESWVPLINGGTTVLMTEDYLTGAALRDLVATGVNTLAMPTPLFGSLVEDDAAAFDGVRTVFVGGDRLARSHVQLCLDANPHLRLLNAYGPVENTINTTLHHIRSARTTGEVPIGAPVTGTSVYLLDDERNIVPRAATGELAVAGDGVALGYLGDADQTAHSFVTIDDHGEAVRVYLTGDLARLGGDGDLMFVGRRDRQLKIRGVRIEAEEIEHLIESVPGVSRGVVLGLPLDAPTKDRLAAFYVSGATDVSHEQVRTAIAAAVPAGFVPDTVVSVSRLPLASNGKIDHRALVAAIVRPAAEVKDEDELTTRVRLAAQELVEAPVGSDEDVFDLGATSLTAIRLSTRLEDLTGRRLGVRDVLRARTPRRMARVLAESPVVSAETVEHDDPDEQTSYVPEVLPTIFGSFWSALRSGSSLDEAVVPILYELRGPLDTAALSAALDVLVARHEVLRVRFDDAADQLRVEVVAAARADRLLQVQPASPDLVEATRTATNWVMAPFDLRSPSPIRAALFPAGDDAVLAIGVHHVFFDGWSARLFVRELTEIYDALGRGKSHRRTARPPSYFRVIGGQRERDRVGLPRAIWTQRKRFAEAPELQFPLPPGRPWTGPAAEVVLDLPEALVHSAAAAAGVVGGTVMSVYFAAYVSLLRDYIGAREPAVAVPVSGRYTEEESQLIGCMAGLVPLSLSAESDTALALATEAALRLQSAMEPPQVPIAAIMPTLRDGYQRHPLLQAYLLQEEIPPLRIELGHVVGTLVRVPSRNAVPEITIELWPHPASGGVLRHRTDAISDGDAQQLAQQFVSHVDDVTHALLASVDSPSHR